MCPKEIAIQIVKELSTCKYIYDQIIDGAIAAFEHQHNFKINEPDKIKTKEEIKKALEWLYQ